MQEPSTTRLLDAWERGLGKPAVLRPLALLSASDADSSEADNEALPVGVLDARLHQLRRWAFGTRVDGAAYCPACSVELELSFDTSDLQAAPPSGDGAACALRVDDYHVRFRLPNSLDMRAAGRVGSVAAARGVLLERCVTAELAGTPIAPGDLPAHVVERVEDAMAEHDPQAVVELALSCAECGHEWQVIFDVGEFLWFEVDRWAKRMLMDVVTLASAFGWTERQVLELTPSRREAYLDLCVR